MNREQMEHVIVAGGSVLHSGRIITRVEDLPTPAQLAAGNPEAEKAAAEQLDQQIAELQRQRSALAQIPATVDGKRADASKDRK